MRRGAAPGARAGTGRSEMMASPAQQMARVHRILPGVALATFALTGLLLVLSAPAHGDATLRARIQQAARVTYIHGMTAELAEAEFGAESVPVLLELLSDRDFERRDNVVAVLGFLGGNEAADALEALLRHPPASPQIPDEDRALLLAPQSLGQIAGRGHARALEALLAMTAHGANGGVLSATAARSGRPISMRDDLVEMAFRGLAYAGSDAARARLEGVASGALRPTAAGRDLRPAAARGLRLADELGGGAPAAPPRQGSLDAEQRSAAPPHIAAEAGGAAVGGGTVAGAFDGSHAQVNRSLLSYANHVQVTNPMDDAKLDEVLGNASLEMGRATFAADVACCTSVARTGTAQVFGTPTDGLDVIDDNAELVSVLNDSVARAKVVRLINWCGSTGSNIIGCAWVGGNGMALVRFATTNPQREGALWAHEYGHNTGLNHNTISNSYIMWGSLGSSNVGLTQAECDAYHSPGSGTQAILEDTGACTDVDVDEVHDVLDNCPAVPNNDQADADGDGRGDACEDPGCNNGFLDPGEDCDGANLAGETCVSQGFDGGTLACSGSCTFDTSACTTCGDGVREGAEECDGADLGGQSCSDFACATGSLSCTPACTLQSPFETCGACECNFDGVCGAPEDCILCPDDCIQGGGPTCGNGLCEIADGEDCLSCPGDCNGLQSGNPANRFCCGDGAGDNPVSCGDARCTASGFDCTEVPATVSCCGDATCEGIENEANCALDCSVVGCGDAFCDPASEDACSCAADCGAPPAGESGLCDDGIDNDCDTLSDCADGDCVLDPFCAPPACDDGLDNDGDGLTDVADPGCDSAADDSERSPALPCDDGIDNDLDGGTDYDVAGLVGDLGCRDPEWLREDPQCQDGDDNDGDEGIDFDGGASLNGGTPLGPADPTCADKPFKNREKPNVCGLGFELTLLLLPWAALRRWRRAAPARV